MAREWCWYNLEKNQGSTQNDRQWHVMLRILEHNTSWAIPKAHTGGRSHGRPNSAAVTVDHEEIRKEMMREKHVVKGTCGRNVQKHATEGR